MKPNARVPYPIAPAARAAACLACLVLAGCATVIVPNGPMALAEAAVQRASTPCTRELAAVQLQLASDKLAGARRAMGHKDYVRARRLAEQAEVDAQAAESHARSSRSRQLALAAVDAAHPSDDCLARPQP